MPLKKIIRNTFYRRISRLFKTFIVIIFLLPKSVKYFLLNFQIDFDFFTNCLKCRRQSGGRE